VEGFYRLTRERQIDDNFFALLNPDNYGGTPVLGINSNVIIGHGASNNIAIKNMILLSQHVVEADLPSRIKKHLKADEQN
jgi:glycerol-3-phosphate acyltransferase PlsX